MHASHNSKLILYYPYKTSTSSSLLNAAVNLCFEGFELKMKLSPVYHLSLKLLFSILFLEKSFFERKDLLHKHAVHVSAHSLFRETAKHLFVLRQDDNLLGLIY